MVAVGLAVVILLVLAIFWAMNYTKDQSGNMVDDQSGEVTDAESPIITEVDITSATTDEQKLPAGFPSDLPIEFDGLSLSYAADYQAADINDKVIEYVSTQSVADVVAEYEAYMTDNDYDFNTKEFNDGDLVQVRGLQTDNVLSVVIEVNADDEVMVTVGYSESANAIAQ